MVKEYEKFVNFWFIMSLFDVLNKINREKLVGLRKFRSFVP